MLLLVSVLLLLGAPCACVQERTCEFPQIKHGHIYDEKRYKEMFPVAPGKYFYYTCHHSFVSPTQKLWTQITCTEEGWSPTPHCLRQCFFPWVENGQSASSGQIHLQGATVPIACDAGYSLPNNLSNITCTESGWSTHPVCSQTNSKGECGKPPSIDNGDITSVPLQLYASGSAVQYQCQNLYTLQGDSIILCNDGKWSKPPNCLHPCVISEGIMNKYNIKLRWTDKGKIYAQTGQAVEFECKHGYAKMTSPESFRTICMEGKLSYPTCG